MRRRTLRTRLFLALALVGVVPVAVLAIVFGRAVVADLRERDRGRRDAALRTLHQELAARRNTVRERLGSLGPTDLARWVGGADAVDAARVLARHSELPLLSVLDAEGRVLSSSHWPESAGLPDPDAASRDATGLRDVTVARGHGTARRLAVTATRPAIWNGAATTLRAGFPVDVELIRPLSALPDLEIGIYDGVAGTWTALPDGTLARWAHPDLAARSGEHEGWSWSAEELGGAAWGVAAAPGTGTDPSAGRLLRLAAGVSAAALVFALLAGAALASRISRPARELADGVRSVSVGILDREVRVAGDEEMATLAEAFNEMTRSLRESRTRLVQAERVAAWREMARRLAHELRKPLFPIQVSIETLRRARNRDGATRPSFDALLEASSATILDELRALGRIVGEFEEFARLPGPRPVPVSVNEVVEGVLSLYRDRARGVSVEPALDPELPEVPADRDLLARAVGNLVANALEAMPDGGRLTVSTAARRSAVVIEVADTGPGLAPQTREHLFAPGFTTKANGTGLGLAIVQGIVADHAGRVEVEDAPGGGTRFRLVLPAPGPGASVSSSGRP